MRNDNCFHNNSERNTFNKEPSKKIDYADCVRGRQRSLIRFTVNDKSRGLFGSINQKSVQISTRHNDMGIAGMMAMDKRNRRVKYKNSSRSCSIFGDFMSENNTKKNSNIGVVLKPVIGVG